MRSPSTNASTAGKAQGPVGAEVIVRMHTALERHESMETITGAKKSLSSACFDTF
jgi:hypothetical protein